jgi:hypothetical protein
LREITVNPKRRQKLRAVINRHGSELHHGFVEVLLAAALSAGVAKVVAIEDLAILHNSIQNGRWCAGFGWRNGHGHNRSRFQFLF